MRIVMAAAFAALTLGGCRQEAAVAQPDVQHGEVREPLTAFYTTAAARDGDDLEISVRMNGFDAPERGKMCGDVNVWREARDALNAMVRGRRVDCVLLGHDEQDERMVARCSVEGRDIGEQMVEQGWARDWPRFSDGRYAQAEARARQARRGIWGLQCPADLWGARDYSAQ
jgi:endonuclease YncB( thermonuclease family)